MEDEVCIFDKFGFCRFKSTCKRKHFNQKCEDLSSCKNIKSCMKRHPKTCKRFAFQDVCRFGSTCAYNHKEKTSNTEDSEMKEKVKLLEAVVQKMFLNVIKLEAEDNELKTKIKNRDIIEEPVFVSEHTDNHNIKNAESKSSQERTVNEDDATAAVKIGEGKQNMDLKCDLCDYSCKKKNMMKKHMKIKHSVHKCNICGEGFSTVTDLLQHMADKHSKKTVHFECVKAKDDINAKDDTFAKVEENMKNVNMFKCLKCNKLFSKDDTLNKPMQENQTWCSLCTILSYGEKEYGLVQP